MKYNNIKFLKETDIIQNNTENKFITYDGTLSGKTICNNDTTNRSYCVIDPITDISDNAFSLRITDDGRIGYRLATKDCNYSLVIEEGYSDINIINNEIWNHIVVRMIFDRRLIECGKPRNFKLFFYINGFLKYVSKELPELMFAGLMADREKQQGVPYNISIGGGALGLMETIYNGYSNDYVQNMDIEKYFCGSFIGAISNFRMYTCQFDYTKVLNNYYYFQNTMI